MQNWRWENKGFIFQFIAQKTDHPWTFDTVKISEWIRQVVRIDWKRLSRLILQQQGEIIFCVGETWDGKITVWRLLFFSSKFQV